MSSDVLQEVTNEYENFKAQIVTDLENVSLRSKLKITNDDVTQSQSSPVSIDYR